MTLSPIQNFIITKLKNADTLRFTDLRPPETENDQYNYHLKSLIAKGLVAKTPHGYSLTRIGERYVADVFHTSDQAQRLFKVNVITIVSRENKGQVEILNQRRTAQPSYGKVGVMGGTILKGEPLLEGATRKLQNETGLTATFRLVGQERRLMYRGDELFSDVIFPICYADDATGDLIDTEYGHNFWVPIDEAIDNEGDPNDSIAAIAKVLRALKAGKLAEMPLFDDETRQQGR